MRVNFQVSNIESKVKVQQSTKPKIEHSQFITISHDYFSPSLKSSVLNSPSAITKLSNVKSVSFTGNGTEEDVKVFVGAEMPPYCKKGGVATVMNDYNNVYKDPMVIPYYNGKRTYDPKTGNPTSKVSVLKDANGTPIYTNLDQDKFSYDEIMATENRGKNTFELEEVSRKTMQWGEDPSSEIILYRVKDNPKHFMIYSNETAKMTAPYADGSYAYSSSGKPLNSSNWEGTPYGKFNKAIVELFPETGIKAKTIVCSDTQTAYVPEYMAKKVLANDPFWRDVKPTYVAHNLCDGYTGSISGRNMFVNLGATQEQINAVKNDPLFQKALIDGTENEYFAKMLPDFVDASGNTADIMVPIAYRKQGFVTAMTTVSEEYANSIVSNPRVSPSLKPILEELKNEGKFGGILNGLDDPKLAHTNPIGLPNYGNAVSFINSAGETVNLEAFQVFPEKPTLEQVREIKKHNKISLLSRLTGECTDSSVIAGANGKKVNLIGAIDKKWIEKINQGEDVTLAVSWGRGDKQKALDTVLDSFMSFAKTEEGKNSIMVLGGELKDDKATTEAVKSRLKIINADAMLKGRVVYLDGFAPGMPMASAADMAIFPSRFAPCELTDLEAMKKLCVPIVSSTQGLKQKNFDPRNLAEANRATSYKTSSEYFALLDDMLQKTPEFKAQYDKLLEAEIIKLTNRGVEQSLIETLAKNNVDKMAEVEELLSMYSDKNIATELSEAMKAFVTRDDDLAQRILDNMINTNTTFDGNRTLHPDGRSTAELYDAIHFKPEAQKPTKDLFNFPETLKDFANKTKENAEQTEKQISKNVSKISQKAIGFIVAGAVAIGGALALYINHQKKLKMAESNEGKIPVANL